MHAAAWKRLFDEFLKKRSDDTGQPFVPCDIDTDCRRYVDGKPRSLMPPGEWPFCDASLRRWGGSGWHPLSGNLPRSGDLDSGLAWYLSQTEHMTVQQFHQMVNQESGLLGISDDECGRDFHGDQPGRCSRHAYG